MTELTSELPAVELVEGRTQLSSTTICYPLLSASAISISVELSDSSTFRLLPAGTGLQSRARRPQQGRLNCIVHLYDRPARPRRSIHPRSGCNSARRRLPESPGLWREDTAFRTRKRRIAARSPGQQIYIKALRENDLVFGLGPAGTGKTYLAVAAAVDLLMTGRVERIILSRPAVEAGERLGFLPGDLRDKVDPYLRPIFDALNDMLPADQLAKRLGSGEIEVAPIAFMRGRTLSHAFVILDEAQNTTPVQIKMFLTRLGFNSRMVVTGDPSQVD